jgi:hypothetical protein
MLSKVFLISIIFSVSLLCFSSINSVYASSLGWSYTYGGWGGETAYRVIETSDGGYALAGDTGSYDAGNGDFWLVKTDKDGTPEWNQTYGDWRKDTAYSLVQTQDGGFALAGSTMNYGAENHDMWLVKTDSYGNVEWNKTYGGPVWEKAYSFVMTSDGGYALAGETNNVNPANGSFFLVKTDVNGNMEWNQTYGGDLREIAYSVVESSSGGYALAGYTWSFSSGGNEDFWLVKTDEFGNVEWNQTYGGSGVDVAYSLVETLDSGYALAGRTNSFGDGDDDILLVKTDQYGEMEWMKTYGEVDFEGCYSLIEVSNGGFALAGYTITYSFGEALQDAILIQTNENGNMEWYRTYGNIWSSSFNSLIESSDGGYILAGKFVHYSSPESSDFWFVKTDEIGIIPEFPLSIILPISIVSTMLIVFLRNRFQRKRLE